MYVSYRFPGQCYWHLCEWRDSDSLWNCFLFPIFWIQNVCLCYSYGLWLSFRLFCFGQKWSKCRLRIFCTNAGMCSVSWNPSVWWHFLSLLSIHRYSISGLFLSHSWSPELRCWFVLQWILCWFSFEWNVCVFFSVLCVICVCFISVSSFLLSFCYRMPIKSFTCELTEFWICCHIQLQ